MDLSDRGQFLNMAAAFEVAMVALAFVIGWLTGIGPLEAFRPEWPAVLYGIAAAVPLFLVFAVTHRFAFGPFSRIKDLLVELLGPSLNACRWYDLLLLSALVGFSEELLFRGVLQPWLAGWGKLFGLVASNVIFGMAHAITPMYAVLAGIIGIYLGMSMELGDERNVVTPMVAHAVYDYLAFLVVIRTYRKQQSQLHEEQTPE